MQTEQQHIGKRNRTTGNIMLTRDELAAPLELFPPVEFCCAYGSSLLPNNSDKGAMVDYILGVADPAVWHAENMERNKHHYSSWMSCLGPKAVTQVADRIGVGVHFNPFVQWKTDKMIKYGVVRMQDLYDDVLTWNRLYLSGRLQKPVYVVMDNQGIEKVNAINLKAAVASALLLEPAEFSEEDFYSRICSLSYMGDIRMMFAEDKNKVQKIVQGSFNLFQNLYKPYLAEHINSGLLNSTKVAEHSKFKQDLGLPATMYLFSSLPSVIQRQAAVNRNMLEESSLKSEKQSIGGQHGHLCRFSIASRDEAANCVRRVVRKLVMVSSTRQAVSGVLAAGGANAFRYLRRKMTKAWNSRTS